MQTIKCSNWVQWSIVCVVGGGGGGGGWFPDLWVEWRTPELDNYQEIKK